MANPLTPTLIAIAQEAMAKGWQQGHDQFCDYGPGEHPQYHPGNPHDEPKEG